jgi:threonyl-tRNA synthetase
MAGVLHGLMRVRGFTQDDAHLFCRWDQVDAEIDRVIGFILRVLRTFGFTEFEVNLSTRPEKYVGADADWERATASLEAAIKRHGLKYQVDPGGGAFYGPKIDVKLKDCLDRMWQCSTLQLDFNNPARFEMQFTNSKGEREQPVMIHRALLGSVERFIGILVEQYAGAFPAWLAPEQVHVVSLTDDQRDAAMKVCDALVAGGIRARFIDTSEPIKAKVRDMRLAKVPMEVVVGGKDVEKGGATLTLREAQKDQRFMTTSELVAFAQKHCTVPQV